VGFKESLILLESKNRVFWFSKKKNAFGFLKFLGGTPILEI
jgi:hypothetical protein